MNNKKIFYLSFFLIIMTLMTGRSQDKTTVTYYEDLAMDLYVPDGPLDGIVLFVHGGGFGGGSREGGDVFCRNIIEMNSDSDLRYAAITMSYTLKMTGRGFGCDISEREKREVFLDAGREISQAVDWILENGGEYGLESDRIILAGSSAGAEAILHAAFWEETRKDDNGENILPEDFTYHALISMAGALIDIELINGQNAVPALLFHGTCDNLVPYASAPHHYCDPNDPGFLMLHGSASIAEKLEALGTNYALISECGGGHEWAGLPKDEYFGKVKFFLTDLLMDGNKFQYKETIQVEVDCDYPDLGVCGG